MNIGNRKGHELVDETYFCIHEIYELAGERELWPHERAASYIVRWASSLKWMMSIVQEQKKPKITHA